MRILSIDGGGYLGLATATFIDRIEQHFGCKFADQFDLFCGTSTGAILALGLATGKCGEELKKLYVDLGDSVFPRRALRSTLLKLKANLRAKHNARPLRDALESELGTKTLGDLVSRNKFALVTAFCVTTGKVRVFKTDHSTRLSTHNTYKLVDIAMASSAAPTYFPLVRIDHPQSGHTEYFCDGGVAANHPALLGMTEALREFGTPASEVQLLSLGTPRNDLQDKVRNPSRGLWGWRHTLPSIFIDANAELADELMKRITDSYDGEKPVYERITMQNSNNLEIDEATPGAKDELVRIGHERASDQGVRTQVKRVLGE